MSKMTTSQRLLRPVVNFLVERYFPKGAFFGKEYFTIFKKWDKEKGSMGYSAALYLQSIVRENDAETMVTRLGDVIVNGENVGDWEISIRKMKDGEFDQTTP